MKKIFFLIVVLIMALFADKLRAQEAKDITKLYKKFTEMGPITDKKQNIFPEVDFSFAWGEKEPYHVAIQFVNTGYTTRKFKFFIKDLTTQKIIILNKRNNSPYVIETLDEVTYSPVWSGSASNIKDDFLLTILSSDGGRFDVGPLSLKDQK